MGPFMVIGNFSPEKHWAHSWSSAAFLMSNIGPIQVYRQYFSCTRMGPFVVIGSHFYEQHWAHSSSSAAFFPYKCLCRELYLLLVGPCEIIAKIFPWAHPYL